MPYHWYKKLVISGARYLQFPEHYIAAIEAVESVEDHEGERRAKKEVIIDKINNYR